MSLEFLTRAVSAAASPMQASAFLISSRWRVEDGRGRAHERTRGPWRGASLLDWNARAPAQLAERAQKPIRLAQHLGGAHLGRELIYSGA